MNKLRVFLFIAFCIILTNVYSQNKNNTRCNSNLAEKQALYFDHKTMKKLPSWVTKCKGLKIIEFYMTEKLDLYDAFFKLSLLDSLESISIVNCNIDSLPNNINMLKELKYVILTGNRLESFPNNIQFCKKLNL